MTDPIKAKRIIFTDGSGEVLYEADYVDGDYDGATFVVEWDTKGNMRLVDEDDGSGQQASPG